MDHRSVESAIVVGNSMGGKIAAEVAARHPERVSRLVLSDATGSGRNGRVRFVLPFMNPRKLQRVGFTTGEHYDGPGEKDRARRRFAGSFWGTEEEWPYLQVLHEGLRASFDPLPEDKLSKIRAPTLLVWGDDDDVVPMKALRWYQEGLQDSVTVIIPEGGHVPMMKRPEPFNCAMESVPWSDAEPGGCVKVKDGRRAASKGTEAYRPQ